MDFKLVIQLSILLELTDQICDSFNDKNYFLEISIYLSKVFDTIDHSILLKKWNTGIKGRKKTGIKERNLSWFQSYLSNHKQYIEYSQENKTGSRELLKIICGVL